MEENSLYPISTCLGINCKSFQELYWKHLLFVRMCLHSTSSIIQKLPNYMFVTPYLAATMKSRLIKGLRVHDTSSSRSLSLFLSSLEKKSVWVSLNICKFLASLQISSSIATSLLILLLPLRRVQAQYTNVLKSLSWSQSRFYRNAEYICARFKTIKKAYQVKHLGKHLLDFILGEKLVVWVQLIRQLPGVLRSLATTISFTRLCTLWIII